MKERNHLCDQRTTEIIGAYMHKTPRSADLSLIVLPHQEA